MTRRLSPEDARLWSTVAATVRPMPGRTAVKAEPAPAKAKAAAPARIGVTAPAPARPRKPATAPEAIEPGRKKRIVRGRAPIEAAIDLHGMNQDRAEAAVRAFLFDAYARDCRAVLIITGRGVSGDGVLRRRAPDWLAASDLRHVVAGFSEAHRKHGGDGALYVALKRRPVG